MSNPAENMTGVRFGRLIVVKVAPKRKASTMWECICNCGVTCRAAASDLKRGRITSCGCFRAECVKVRASTHGMKKSPEYYTWVAIKQRCLNPKNQAYPNYGGRGISICPRWLNSFENFYADMGPRPAGLTIERINNDGNYEPSNCKWASMADNCHNKRNNIRFKGFGTEKIESDWASIIGVSKSTIARAVSRGMSIESLAAKHGLSKSSLGDPLEGAVE